MQLIPLLFDFVLLSKLLYCLQLLQSPVIATSHQYLNASSQWRVNTSGWLGTISSWMWEAHGSSLYLCMLNSSSTHRPDSCAPSSLDAGSDHWAVGLASLPQNVASAPSGITTPMQRTCRAVVVLRPYTPLVLDSSSLPQGLSLPLVTPA